MYQVLLTVCCRNSRIHACITTLPYCQHKTWSRSEPHLSFRVSLACAASCCGLQGGKPWRDQETRGWCIYDSSGHQLPCQPDNKLRIVDFPSLNHSTAHSQWFPKKDNNRYCSTFSKMFVILGRIKIGL